MANLIDITHMTDADLDDLLGAAADAYTVRDLALNSGSEEECLRRLRTEPETAAAVARHRARQGRR